MLPGAGPSPCRPPATRSPVRSLRKQLCPHRPAPPPPAPRRPTRLRTSGGPSSALWEGGVRDKGVSPGWAGHPGRGDRDPSAATALTRRLEELRRSHPFGEADLRQVIACRLQLLGGLARTLGGLVAHQPFGPVGCRLKALQLPLPMRAPVPTVAEGTAAGWHAGGEKGVSGTCGTPPPAPCHPLSPPVLTCQPGEAPLCLCSPAPAPQRLLQGVSGGPPLRCPSPLRARPHRLPVKWVSATSGGGRWGGARESASFPQHPAMPHTHLERPRPSPCWAASVRPSCLRRPSGEARGCKGGEIHQHRDVEALPQPPSQPPTTPRPRDRAAPSSCSP